jgi:hypothetical protein
MMLDRLTASADTWDLLWSWVGRVLTVNAGVAVTNLPLLAALAAIHRPWQFPLLFAVLGLGVGPSLAAAFGYLDGGGFVACYRRLFGRSLLRWSVVVAGLAVLATDAVGLHANRPGALLVPMFVVLAALLLAAGVLAQAALVARPDAGWRFAAYAAVRHGGLSLLSLVLLAGTAVVVSQRPLLGLATLPGCALIVVWHNSRASLG